MCRAHLTLTNLPQTTGFIRKGPRPVLCGSRTCKPNSVCRCRQDGHSSGPRITAGLKRPTRRLWRAEPARLPGEPEGLPGSSSLFGLAPCGVCPARRITATAVRSYRTFSPLPGPCGPGGMFSVALSVDWFPTLRKGRASMGHPLPDVIRHTALRSSDFPLVLRRATVRSGCQPIHYSAGDSGGGWRRQSVPSDVARHGAFGL